MLWPLRQLIKLINYVQCASRQIVIENYQLTIATDKAPEIRFINSRAHMTQSRLFIFPFSLFFFVRLYECLTRGKVDNSPCQ